jgi:SSS family solute:Na+ symporter
VVLGICWVLVIKALHSDLYVYLQSVQGYLSPAIAVLFLLGAFSGPAPPRRPRSGRSWSASSGGFARLAADLVMRNDGVAVATLKQQLYRHTITQDQYAMPRSHRFERRMA